jgi:predicted DNA-binding transcriptional regulator YafY
MPHEFFKRDRLARLMRITNLLYHNPNGLTAKQIAQRIQMTPRTVYRDIQALELDADIKIWRDKGRFGAHQSEFLAPLKLTLEEAVTLFLSARLMQRYQDHLDPHVVSAFEKLASILPRSVERHVHATVASLANLPRNDARTRIFDLLASGWAEGKKVRIKYPRTTGSTTTMHERVISPYFLEPNPSGHSRYVIGHDSDTNNIRTFRIERITSAQPTSEHFAEPENFDVTARFKHAWGVSDEDLVTVRLRFHNPTAQQRLQESRWHPSQTLENQLDGTLIMTLEVGGLLEITPWILGWGSAVEVIDPPELRQTIARTAAEMAHRNASPPP